ncbi:MAG: hypothetical protein UW37_C0007G0028 [Candidatus Gottesmanbacteria bacterium GW2011_GWA2_44_17]|uniref:Uncharacterized protein n=3 Tax=Candidatus Gottesmaniibacteriota TaxID=1752720 RepID=A0A0G1IQ45_9BACT|nr:MAG: hypothetical protein UV63_C0019G0011 [Microgenomates group bacterium GW2011_GWC1_43_11]KKT38893.1 MAG: hypothetical protein UW22_C0004G0023 [Candidatus Gottesmanbacteria bacterium GW2011_GWB1_44_11c]KKT47462.1 MAG: hypothetical protein UW37_C0007G0028 [Candidatus Gottesmanbacteria bacterium GW2011_GWA2_44_17]KKT61255.1 MAG: hypothetical protein UW52_C0007G0022 [Candidatus Gottesmanbacteria bacterium GW2011_GWA1_44_24b]HCM82475.1 hypothetical protein [Patescibacteria group bacterium]
MTPDVDTIVWLGMKLMMLVGLGIYIVFAFIIVRQEQLMSKTLEAASERIISILTWLHLGAAVVVFMLALLIL